MPNVEEGTCAPNPVAPPINPSPPACLKSNSSPLSVPAVLPNCSVSPCKNSVLPSRTPEPANVVFNLPMFLAPIAFKTPEKVAVPKAAAQSEVSGSVLPLFLALSNATGPAICTASNNPGPSKPPINAPGRPPTVSPAPAPIPLDNKDPPSCPACSTTAKGKALKSYIPSSPIN